MSILRILIVFFIPLLNVLALNEGKLEYFVTESDKKQLVFGLYKGAKFFIQINCENPLQETNVTLDVAISQSPCSDASHTVNDIKYVISNKANQDPSVLYHSVETYRCDDHIILKGDVSSEKSVHPQHAHPVYVIPKDGIYVLGLKIDVGIALEVNVRVHIEVKNDYGYLSAFDWPLLLFYGFMCIFYIIIGLIWLILSFLQWRDLLRVQFWIGGVILLGMLEKATFYAEYQSINNTGVHVQGAMLFAEWVSCAKRTLARMLVIIVSLGFGIVKPRLGATFHRVVGVGLLYFFLAASEAYLRITRTKTEPSKDLLVASIPLAVLDSAICWWIFSALVNTTRTLRLRRNETKLALYRHFTNTLIFSVVASVFFMLYCLKTHHYTQCLTVWKDLWLEDAFWHILFSCLLLVIMILWRPTNNNQRYAFVPLLDTTDDNDEEEQLVNDAYGVKVRIHHQKQANGGSPRQSVDDDLKWLEENVKSDPALPILDSDEELVTTRFEVSKMQ